MDYTRLTNLEVTGELKTDELKTDAIKVGLTESSYQVTSANAVAAAGDAPTKAEFDAVVTLLNEVKTDYNALLHKIING